MDLTIIYGIEFDEAVLRGGKNDFDRAYPFGAMQLCNVSYQDGERHVIYENEPGFCRTGESGNVMVQIPKFYSRREKNGTVERWMISGTKNPGFEIEPAFLRNGRELDAIYVGCYNTTSNGNTLFSSSGALPNTARSLTEFREEFAAAGYDSYGLTACLCLRR